MVTVVTANAILAVVATYAALRGFAVLFEKEADPAGVVWSPSAHIAMFWRLGIGVYVGGMLSMLVFMLARRDFALAVRVTGVLVPVVGALIAIQGVLLP
jgi:hypothetical protein